MGRCARYMPQCQHNCKWCKDKIIPALFCSVRCAKAYADACKPWPIGYCALCGNVFNAKGKPQQLFCSQACSHQAPPQPDDTPPDCAVCGAPSKRRSWFCAKHNSSDLFLQEWLDGADGSTASGALSKICRDWLLQQTDACSACGIEVWENPWYSGPVPREIDHINGTPSDNRRVNLRPLCPNCHATTDTYRGKNRGRGRQTQRKRDERLAGK